MQKPTKYASIQQVSSETAARIAADALKLDVSGHTPSSLLIVNVSGQISENTPIPAGNYLYDNFTWGRETGDADPGLASLRTLGGGSTAACPGDDTRLSDDRFPKADYAIYQDAKASGTNGGTATAGTQTRTLNTTVVSSGDSITRTNNIITCVAGTYEIEASAPAYSVGNHQITLVNNATSAVLQRGTSEWTSNTASNATSRSIVTTILTFGASTSWRIDHTVQYTYATYGLGDSANMGGEVYTQVKIKRIA